MNTTDLSRYLMGLMQGYTGKNRLISAQAYQEMIAGQHEQKDRIFWSYSRSGIMGRNGGDTGVIAMMNFDPKTNLGYTLLCNMDPAENGNARSEFEKVWTAIRRYAPFFQK